jgi:predicted dehydrogenase
LASKDLELKAIYSRSLKSAKDVAGEVSQKIDLYSEDISQGYEDILKRDDIQALVVRCASALELYRKRTTN